MGSPWGREIRYDLTFIVPCFVCLFACHRREAVPVQLGGLRLAICALWRADEALPQAHRSQALQMRSVQSLLLTLRPPGPAHEAPPELKHLGVLMFCLFVFFYLVFLFGSCLFVFVLLPFQIHRPLYVLETHCVNLTVPIKIKCHQTKLKQFIAVS